MVICLKFIKVIVLEDDIDDKKIFKFYALLSNKYEKIHKIMSITGIHHMWNYQEL